jgi:hypothetical protein
MHFEEVVSNLITAAVTVTFLVKFKCQCDGFNPTYTVLTALHILVLKRRIESFLFLSVLKRIMGEGKFS